ncbi:MAG: hypothetical protein ACRCVJ_12975 [Clostridium sp.]|uniref:hypothetical protein n=1 Tax=Clostridium sp. TaxID=1506 RepID=UPI003F40963C
MKKISDLLGEIDRLDLEREGSLDLICNEIDSFYKDSDIGRHSYADVSTYVSEVNEGDIEYLIYNLQCIYNNFDKKGDLENKLKVFKIIDHIELESNREVEISVSSTVDIVQKISGAMKENLQTALNKMEIKEKEINSIINEEKKSIENIQNNMIAVLGIFSAIIVAFFGGLSFLGGVLDNMHNVSAYRLTFISCVFLIGLFNIVFILLYCVAKLTDKKLWSNCTNCSTCENNKKIPLLGESFNCLFKKYPFVIIYNALMGFLVLLLYAMFIIDKYDIPTYIFALNKESKSLIPIFSIGILLFIVIITFFIRFIFRLLKRNRSEESKTQNIMTSVDMKDIDTGESVRIKQSEIK